MDDAHTYAHRAGRLGPQREDGWAEAQMDESMNEMAQPAERSPTQRLGSPELRKLIEGMIRRKVPEGEVDDLVQTVLVDALASDTMPDDDEQLRRWVVGITRHKVADYHRRGKRGRHVELSDQLPGEEPPLSAREWARWAEEQAADDPDAKRTLDWMAREGEGEKLAHIAADEELPATQVRQRVSRMRRWMKERWAAELAAVAVVVVLALIAWRLLREPEPTALPVPHPVPEVDPRIVDGQRLRAEALRACAEEAWDRCVEGLDEAARLDPAGDEAEAVGGARQRAAEALEQQQEAPSTDDGSNDDGEGMKGLKGLEGNQDDKSTPSPSSTAPLKLPPSPTSNKPAPNPNNPLPLPSQNKPAPPVKKSGKLDSTFEDGNASAEPSASAEPPAQQQAPPADPPQYPQQAYPQKPTPQMPGKGMTSSGLKKK